MLRITSISSDSQISSAAAVLLPNDQGVCAARPAGVPPRRQGAFFDPLDLGAPLDLGDCSASAIDSSRRRSSAYPDGTSSFDISTTPGKPPTIAASDPRLAAAGVEVACPPFHMIKGPGSSHRGEFSPASNILGGESSRRSCQEARKSHV